MPTTRMYLTVCCSLCWGTLCLVSAGCNSAKATPVKPKPPEVFVATPIEETVVEYGESTGRMVAVKTVEIRSRVSGYLDKVFFKDGDVVNEGDKLFEIDQRPYQKDLDRTTSAVEQAKAHLERLNRQLVRSKKLLPTKAITQEEYDLTQFDRDEAQAALDAAIASKETADLNMTFTEITSKITGRISRRMVDPGNLVQADVTPLTTVVSQDPIYAYFELDERSLLHLQRLIQEGKVPSVIEAKVVVEIALADEEEYTLRGTIDFLDNQVDVGTGTLHVRAVVDNPKGMLAPGLFVRVRIPIGAPKPAVLVQEEALATDQGQRFVYVVNENDEVSYRRVKVGWLNNGMRVIEEGLSTGDRVVVTGLQRVKPGLKVVPRPVEKEADPSTKVAAAPETKGQPAASHDARAGK